MKKEIKSETLKLMKLKRGKVKYGIQKKPRLKPKLDGGGSLDYSA